VNNAVETECYYNNDQVTSSRDNIQRSKKQRLSRFGPNKNNNFPWIKEVEDGKSPFLEITILEILCNIKNMFLCMNRELI
jgi:hypothetical protein